MRCPRYSMIRAPFLIVRVANAPVPWMLDVRSSKYGLGSSFHGQRASIPRRAPALRLVLFLRAADFLLVFPPFRLVDAIVVSRAPGESCGTPRRRDGARAGRTPPARTPSAWRRAGPGNACSRAAWRARRTRHVVARTP